MPSTAPGLLIEVDGHPATEADLRLRALDTYGHFTAMQIRDGRTRGMDLHLARLDAATRELFGTGLDGERVRAALRHALDGVRDASARVYVHWRDETNGVPGSPVPGGPTGTGDPSLMVTVRPPAVLDRRPRSMMSVPYQRPVPHIKHLGGFAQIHYGRVAQLAGFTDALLTGPGGVVSEGAIANIGFWDGTSVVWPDAPALTGVTMALLKPRLPAAGIPSVRRAVTLADLPLFRTAFVTNSQGIAPVGRIDETVFPGDAELLKTVTEVYEGVEWDGI
ncbi:aminotransferase class IV family protein [Streptomyces odonnellii]|uniref:aminotransferase class IV family protein n=1 Tax=Streptomyces odonnellii TaxID=1417980 RepID=UPI0006252A37|nr:aminotransferase class IV family protein [Streptomyces odonnellii]